MTTTQRDLALHKASNWAPTIADPVKGTIEAYSCARQHRKGNATFCDDYIWLVKWMEAVRGDRKYCSHLQNSPLG